MAAHRYWRVHVTAVVADTSIVIAEVEMLSSLSSGNLCSGGTAIEGSHSGGNVAANAFNDVTVFNSNWATAGGDVNDYVGYDFGLGNDKSINFVTIHAGNDYPTAAPKDFSVDFSDNGSTWTTLWTVTGEPAWGHFEIRTYQNPGYTIPAYSGSPRGTHTYWRFFLLTAVNAFAFSSTELGMLDKSGGTNQLTGGTASSSTTSGALVASNAADGNTSTEWATSTVAAGQWWKYVFGSPVAVGAFSWRASGPTQGDADQSPIYAMLQYSDDNSKWASTYNILHNLAWSVGEVDTVPDPLFVSPATLGGRLSSRAGAAPALGGAIPIFGRLTAKQSTRSARRTGHVLSDKIKIIATPFPAWKIAPIVESLRLHPVQTYAYRAAAQVVEALRLHLAPSQTAIFRKTISDKLKFHAANFVKIPRAITESLRLHDLTVVARTILVLEKLKLHDSSAAPGIYGVALLEHAGLHSAAAYFLGGTLTESLRLHDTALRTYRGVTSLNESIALAALLGESFLIRVDLTEGLDFTDVQVLKAIYRGTISDGIDMFAAYVDPGGGFTSWAINTRTNAVTEYQNYTFNSIARMGHRFVGADSTGLWLLEGNLDDTVDIPTRIKSGWMQLSGSRFTSFKAAYLGLRVSDTGSDFFLKLHSGDDREYVYAVKPQNMRTTKVNMGKGLRSRYFAFELVTVGADYSLDDIEFVPITSQRRV